MSVEFVSVSASSTGNNQDCGILVLQQFLGNHGVIVEYDTLIGQLTAMYRDFGMDYDPNTCQLTADAFEGLLVHHLPDHEIELYSVVQKPNQVIEATLRLIGKGSPVKSQYRLALKSSWDRQRNTVGAGHFVLLNTRLATPEQIIAAIKAKNVTDQRFVACSVASCMALAGYKCDNCAAPYCGAECQRAHWPQHKNGCSH